MGNNYSAGSSANSQQIHDAVGQRRPRHWGTGMGSSTYLPCHGLELGAIEKNVSTLDGVHSAAVPLAAAIPRLPQGLLFHDHKAEWLAGGRLLSIEGTRCGFFAAVAATQAAAPLKEAPP